MAVLGHAITAKGLASRWMSVPASRRPGTQQLHTYLYVMWYSVRYLSQAHSGRRFLSYRSAPQVKTYFRSASDFMYATTTFLDTP